MALESRVGLGIDIAGGAAVPTMQYAFGCETIAAGIRWLYPWNMSGAPTAFATARRALVLVDGTLHDFNVIHDRAGGGTVITYTLYVNAIATAVTFTLNSGLVGPAFDRTTQLAVTQDDLLSVEVNDPGGTLGIAPLWQCIFTADP